MTGAVARRKETLARKKYTNKAGEDIGTPGPESLAGTPSAESSMSRGALPECSSSASMGHRQPSFLHYDGALGGVVTQPPNPPQHDYQEIRSAQRMGLPEPQQRQAYREAPSGQNPFLDHGYVGPRLPTFVGPNGARIGGYGDGFREVKREERPPSHEWPGL